MWDKSMQGKINCPIKNKHTQTGSVQHLNYDLRVVSHGVSSIWFNLVLYDSHVIDGNFCNSCSGLRSEKMSSTSARVKSSNTSSIFTSSSTSSS